MGKHNPLVDAHIAGAGEFAKPILTHMRALLHEVCPEVEETIRWRMPSFDHHGPLLNMAAFKAHCAFIFYKHQLLQTEAEQLQFHKVTQRSDLPSDAALRKLIKAAMKLNEEGVKAPRPKAKNTEKPEVPTDFKKALGANKAANTCFSGFTANQQNEYVAWITEAKTDATRAKRLEQAIAWIAEGKTRNWKYMKKA